MSKQKLAYRSTYCYNDDRRQAGCKNYQQFNKWILSQEVAKLWEVT
ncbi:MAG: hypothetical protein HFJ08_05565 [Lachnospiraceae bacterium]|nr:hypothetical protein [Lachnospiraceae bacterium]